MDRNFLRSLAAESYTRPWTVSMPQTIVLDTELIDEFCLENEKSSQHMNAK